MKSLEISIIESIYLIYMFLFLKTSIDFNILASPKGWLFEHLIGNTRSLRICPFGRIAIFALIFVLIMRNFITIAPYLVRILHCKIKCFFCFLNFFVFIILAEYIL